MRPGKAPTAEYSFLARRKEVSRGGVYALTFVFWALWLYLVLPMVSLLLWVLGFRILFEHMLILGGFEALKDQLVLYFGVVLGMVLLLLAWILWNVLRYGGRKDRRKAKIPRLPDEEITAAFQIDASLLAELRTGRYVIIDFDDNDRLVVRNGWDEELPEDTQADNS